MPRLDTVMAERGLAETRSLSQKLIKNGQVTVNGKEASKPSLEVSDEDIIEIISGEIGRYVSRGGLKLEGALDAFGINPSGLVCCDIGSSTGGFTDCLLKKGAKAVYSVDSGRDQLHPSLRSDKRVKVFESFNAKELSSEVLGEKVDLVVMDVSFISQTKLFASVTRVLKDGGTFVSLIKPQFEVGKENVGKGGIVKDEKIRRKAVQKVIEEAALYSLNLVSYTVSPITGGDGNTEYLAHFIYKGINDGR